ncbi:MAG: hypothetical protein H6828_07210 [Planctomycetes bacterium]|nr:hypothetical protein [Planctomycetota bacterium]
MSAASLCRGCAHLKLVRNASGSEFLLCRKAASDPRFAKYPPQPVKTCPGYAPRD